MSKVFYYTVLCKRQIFHILSETEKIEYIRVLILIHTHTILEIMFDRIQICGRN